MVTMKAFIALHSIQDSIGLYRSKVQKQQQGWIDEVNLVQFMTQAFVILSVEDILSQLAFILPKIQPD